MTEQEQINVNVQRQIDAQNGRIDAVLAKVDMLVAESQQQREDMRRLQERQDVAQAQHNAEVQGMLKHIQGLTIASMVGIGAIAVGILGFLWSTARNMNMSELPQSPPAQSMPVAPTK